MTATRTRALVGAAVGGAVLIAAGGAVAALLGVGLLGPRVLGGTVPAAAPEAEAEREVNGDEAEAFVDMVESDEEADSVGDDAGEEEEEEEVDDEEEEEVEDDDEVEDEEEERVDEDEDGGDDDEDSDEPDEEEDDDSSESAAESPARVVSVREKSMVEPRTSPASTSTKSSALVNGNGNGSATTNAGESVLEEWQRLRRERTEIENELVACGLRRRALEERMAAVDGELRTKRMRDLQEASQ